MLPLMFTIGGYRLCNSCKEGSALDVAICFSPGEFWSFYPNLSSLRCHPSSMPKFSDGLPAHRHRFRVRAHDNPRISLPWANVFDSVSGPTSVPG